MRLQRRRTVQIVIGFVLSVALFGFLLAWMPYQREMRIASRIKANVGDVEIQFGCYGPARIVPWVQRNLLVFNRIQSIYLTEGSHVSMIVSDLEALSNIELLGFNGSDITDRELGHLNGLKTLRILDLRKTATTDSGLEQLRVMTNLERLYLGETAVTDEGLKSVGELIHLNVLDLNQTEISDEGIQHLRGLTKLKQLGVSNSKVTDRGLEFLYSLPNFYYLEVEETRVTTEARDRFRKAFPMCTILPNP